MTTAPVANLLSRLDGAKPAGPGKWAAKCPSHDDQQASLSVGTGDDGRALVFCQAGCATAEVVAAVGLSMADLFPLESDGLRRPPAMPRNPRLPQAPPEMPKRLGQIVKTYDYRDATGVLLFQVVRYDPKDFRQRRPDGKGGWTWKLDDVPRVLYRLPELLAADPSAWIFVVEGEKDADALAGIGMVATCNPGGAGKWAKLSDDSALRGRPVAIIPDKDKPGLAHAQDVAARLHGVAAVVKIIDLPDGELAGRPIKDASDWIESRDGLTATELAAALVEMADAAPEWTPAQEPRPAPDGAAADTTGPSDAEARLCSDIGNAARFTAAARGRFLYHAQAGKWLHYDGRRWTVDDAQAVVRAAKNVALDIYPEARAAAAAGDEPAAQRLTKWALTSQKRERLAAMVDLARCELSVSAMELDADAWLLNVASGTIDLRTGALSPHRPEDRITKLAPVVFDPAAACPLWDSFLTTIMAGDAAKITYLQRIAGMALTGDVRERAMFLFYGTGANGKSVFLDTLAAMLGDYAGEAAPDLLIDRKIPAHPTEQADLCGRRLVVASETEEGGRLRVQLVKRLTGNARIKARFMRRDFFEFDRTHKIIMATNNKPVVREQTHAIWDRLKLIPFTVTIPEPEQDKELLHKLRAQWPGILNWALAGCLAWQRDGLDTPESVDRATAEYQSEQDPLTDFLSERCIMAPDAFTPRADIYRAYTDWATAAGERFVIDKTSFYARLRLKNFADGARRVAGKSERGFEGIGLLSELFDHAKP